MALLDEFGRRLQRIGHLEPRHDDGQAPARKGRDGDFVLDVRELGTAVAGIGGGWVGGGGGKRGVDVEDAKVVQFGEEEGFVFETERVRGREGGEPVG